MDYTNNTGDHGKCILFGKFLNQTTKVVMEPYLKSMLSNFGNLPEQPILSHLLYRSYEIHQDDMNVLVGVKESINPHTVQMNGWKMNPNPINPILSPTPNSCNDVDIVNARLQVQVYEVVQFWIIQIK